METKTETDMEEIERKVNEIGKRERPEHLTFRIGDYFPELAKLK